MAGRRKLIGCGPKDKRTLTDPATVAQTNLVAIAKTVDLFIEIALQDYTNVDVKYELWKYIYIYIYVYIYIYICINIYIYIYITQVSI